MTTVNTAALIQAIRLAPNSAAAIQAISHLSNPQLAQLAKAANITYPATARPALLTQITNMIGQFPARAMQNAPTYAALMARIAAVTP